MRHIRNISCSVNRKQQSERYSSSSFASKALIATAAASTSFVAYYCATALLFSASVAATSDGNERSVFHMEKKKDDTYGIEYSHFDTYPGIELDDNTGVATNEVKTASMKVVFDALDAAGLDEMAIVKGKPMQGDGDDVTLHPKHAHRIGLGTCPVYGCPYLPLDVQYDEVVKKQMEMMRNLSPESEQHDESWIINSSGSDSAAVLTLIGYKGGKLDDQINQDRAIALSPYLYYNINSSNGENSSSNTASTRPTVRLIGAFDGHARYGEKVSEYVVKTLPALLGKKLVEYDTKHAKDEEVADQQKRDNDISHILHATFLELDATSPAEPSGGCTASMVLQLGQKIYIANAGDSRSFIGVHIKNGSNEGVTKLILGTREDKPHLPIERERVEHMGGTVYLPNGFLESGKGTTRVLYKDPNTGNTSGLAMSRSIGDWGAGEVGCIPDPLIDILDMKEIRKRVLDGLNNNGEVEINPATGESMPSNKNQGVTYTEEAIKVFAISATDGLLDYLPETAIVNHVAKGLYEQQTHPLLAIEDLINAAAKGWQEKQGGRYRDDIAIAVADLEVDES